MISYDLGYHDRFNLLCELMRLYPNSKMRKLQKEALRYYPLTSIEGQRQWLSMATAWKAADRLNEELLGELRA